MTSSMMHILLAVKFSLISAVGMSCIYTKNWPNRWCLSSQRCGEWQKSGWTKVSEGKMRVLHTWGSWFNFCTQVKGRCGDACSKFQCWKAEAWDPWDPGQVALLNEWDSSQWKINQKTRCMEWEKWHWSLNFGFHVWTCAHRHRMTKMAAFGCQQLHCIRIN